MMPQCCIESFAEKGVREHFRLAEPGERFTCPRCGRVYEMPFASTGWPSSRRRFWTEVVPPSQKQVN